MRHSTGTTTYIFFIKYTFFGDGELEKTRREYKERKKYKYIVEANQAAYLARTGQTVGAASATARRATAIARGGLEAAEGICNRAVKQRDASRAETAAVSLQMHEQRSKLNLEQDLRHESDNALANMQVELVDTQPIRWAKMGVSCAAAAAAAAAGSAPPDPSVPSKAAAAAAASAGEPSPSGVHGKGCIGLLSAISCRVIHETTAVLCRR